VTSLTVYVSSPDLVEDLMASFRRGGCVARRTGVRSCSVDHPADEREARIEVAFFLRAWRTRHGRVRALLAP
jgi:hypothetical protein